MKKPSMLMSQKISLLSGDGYWHTKSFPFFGIKSVTFSDGPYGLRKTIDNGLTSLPYQATCFPTATLAACSFDENLLEEMGVGLAKEAIDQKVSVILGPAINIKRSPLCGRNFEYFSEDPLLTGRLASAYIRGVQSQNVGSCVKHFAVNNQEYNRMVTDVIIDERALHEIYLKPFEIAIKESNPWCVMASYNQVNGTHVCENSYLLTDVLRKKWNYKGLVLSDWGGVCNPSLSIKNGLDLIMPEAKGVDRILSKDLKHNILTEKDIDRATQNILDLGKKSSDYKNVVSQDKQIYKINYGLAKKVACESIVLLKNDDNLLPITDKKILVVGELAKKPRFKSLGSSNVNPYLVKNFLKVLEENEIDFVYEPGYDLSKTTISNQMVSKALEEVENFDKVIFFMGLPEEKESEGFDREDMFLPDNQIDLLNKILEINKNVVVILEVGSPVELPFKDSIKALLLTYLGGEATNDAIFDLLSGKVNPSGKLAESWPIFASDNPSYYFFPGKRKEVEYRESIFVGYRYYDRARVALNYCFGHGLSYTKFDYSNLKITNNITKEDAKVKISFKLKNVGAVTGKEIVQIYVDYAGDSMVYRPEKELKAFKKITLSPDEEKEVKIELTKEAFEIYDITKHAFVIEDGEYKIYVSSSAADIKLKDNITINFGTKITSYKVYSYWNLVEKRNSFRAKDFDRIHGHRTPYVSPKEFNLDSTFEDIKFTRIGTMIRKKTEKLAKKYEKTEPLKSAILKESLDSLPIRSVLMNGLSYRKANAIVDLANKKTLQGIIKFLF